MEQIVKNIIAGVVSVFTYFFGGWSILLTSLFVLNVLDLMLAFAACEEKVRSQHLQRRGTQKGIMWMWVLVANLVYMVISHLGYDIGVSVANWVALYFILNEVIALEENSSKLGLPMPQPVIFLMDKVKDVIETKLSSGGTKK